MLKSGSKAVFKKDGGVNTRFSMNPEPIAPITLPPMQSPEQEGEWLKVNLHRWLDQEFIPEPVNLTIAERAAQIYVRQRLEGENDL
jgi:hypothetical protein